MEESEAAMSIGEKVLDLLFPKRCIFCRRLTQAGAWVCPRCRDTVPLTGSAATQQFPQLDSCLSPLYYEEPVRGSLLRYKFGGRSAYAEVYGEFLAKCIDENGISCDSITWAPLSRRRLRQRGYDQARLLAEELARRTGLPCEPMLKKTRNNRAQSTMGDARKRRSNVRGVYAVLPGAEIRGKRVLLVDDIVTTGATLSACAGELKRAGAAKVYAVTVARRKE